MKQSVFKIVSNENIANAIYKLVLEGDVSAITRPGQFVNIKIEGLFLRRPISVCDLDDGRLTLIYKAVGKGTRKLSLMNAGGELDILTGLGNGYGLDSSGERPLLIGGGVGVPPMYLLAKRLVEQGKKPTVILGFNTAEDAFYINEFKALGCEVEVATVDGSAGVKGFVTDAMKLIKPYTYFYCCGPEPMLKAVYRASLTSGEFSFEERMGCGFGACMGCTCKTITGGKRICREGPVLRKEDLLWED